MNRRLLVLASLLTVPGRAADRPAYAWCAGWGGQGTAPGQFIMPTGLAVGPDGAFLCKWGSRGTGPGQFDLPYGIAADGAGSLYVADKYNHRVQKFAPATIPGEAK